MFPISWVGWFFRQHVKCWVLPININTVEAKVVEEMHRAQDKLHSSLLGLGHLGEDPAAGGPPAHGEEHLEVGVDFLEGNGPTHTVVVAVLKTVVCHTSWWPRVSVSLLETRYIIEISKLRRITHQVFQDF